MNPKVDDDTRVSLRLAQLIYKRFTPETTQIAESIRARLNDSQYYLRRCQETARLLQKCENSGFHGAGLVHRSYVEARVAEVLKHVEKINTLLLVQEKKPPGLREIHEEIMAVARELDAELCLEKGKSTIEVETEEISFQEVNLGRFRIVLNLKNSLTGSHPYKIKALDPNPAHGDDECTHPHVSSERLCEGEASAAIRKALGECRLTDFFELALSVLRTYNPHGAYAQIETWEGQACSDCGYRASEDDMYTCEQCADPVCSECSCTCHECENTVCMSCSQECVQCGDRFCNRHMDNCGSCEESVCPNCLTSCPGCSRSVCEGCLKDCDDCGYRGCKECIEDGLCEECRLKSEEEDEVAEDEEDDDEVEEDEEDEEDEETVPSLFSEEEA